MKTPYVRLYIEVEAGFQTYKIYWDANGCRWTTNHQTATLFLAEELPKNLNNWTIKKEEV